MPKTPDRNDRTAGLERSIGKGSPESVIAEYLKLCEQGKRPDPERFVASHPHLREILVEFFGNQAEFSKLAQPIREFQTVMGAREKPAAPKQLGDYDLLDEIGRGGMGVIYRARQRSLQRMVALKLIHRSKLVSENDVLRFHREAESAAALDHPNIVPIYEIGESDGHHFFAMKLAEGGNLENQIKAGLPIRNSVSVLLQVARAIHVSHQNGILHRDLKPSNILIDKPVGDTGKYTNTRREDRSSPSQSPFTFPFEFLRNGSDGHGLGFWFGQDDPV